jgi:hypothetical protein
MISPTAFLEAVEHKDMRPTVVSQAVKDNLMSVLSHGFIT